MSRATSTMRDLAVLLIAHEQAGQPARAGPGPAAFLVCERLRPVLATLMGSGGFHALLGRALSLGSAQVEWLRTVALTGEDLGVSEKVREKAGEVVWAEGSVVLVTELFTLLVAFIGGRLTLQVVRETWPALPLKDFNQDDLS